MLFFTFTVGSHAEADWLRVQGRSGEGRAVSILSSLLSTSDESGERRDFGSTLSSSLSTSKATRLWREQQKTSLIQKSTGNDFWLWGNLKTCNTWGRRCPSVDFLSDWSNQRRRDWSAWREPGQRGRFGERRIQREGRNLLDTVEEYRWLAGELVSPQRPITCRPSPCSLRSLHRRCTWSQHLPPKIK